MIVVINHSWDEFIEGNRDFKEEEFYKFLIFSVVPDSAFTQERYVLDEEEDFYEVNPLYAMEYYDYLNVPYDEDNIIYYEYSVPMERLSYVYNSQLFEGEEGIYQFLAAYFHYDISHSTNVKEDVLNYIWNTAERE